MKKVYLFLIALVMLGCGINTPSIPHTISCSPSVINTDHKGTSCSVTISSNAQWSASTNKSWVTFTPNNGEGDSFVEIKVAAGIETDSAIVLFANDEASAKLMVYRIAVTSITITPDTLILYSETSSARLSYKLTPAGITGTVTWESSDTTIATVDAMGNVYAKNYGECTITATCGTVKDTCVVQVLAPPTVTGITITPSTLILDSETTSARLSYTLTPAGATGIVTWESSDTTIAVVDAEGNVYAKGYGECTITATCGTVKATCVVQVKTYSENIKFNAAVLWDIDTLYFGGVDTVIKSSAGTEYRCYKTLGTLYVMSEGFYVNNHGYLDGTKKGSIIEVKAMFYYGTSYLNGGSGVSFMLGDWAITDKYDFGTAHVAEPGEIDQANYMAQMTQFFQYYNNAQNETEYSNAYDHLELASNYLTNTTMRTLTYHSATEGYSQDAYYTSLMDDGIITEGYFVTNNNGPSQYMLGFDYSKFYLTALDNTNYTWGCDVTIEQTSGNYAGYKYTLNSNTLHTKGYEYTYGTKPANSMVRKLKELHAPILKKDYPQVAARLERQLSLIRNEVVVPFRIQ